MSRDIKPNRDFFIFFYLNPSSEDQGSKYRCLPKGDLTNDYFFTFITSSFISLYLIYYSSQILPSAFSIFMIHVLRVQLKFQGRYLLKKKNHVTA